MGNERHMLFAPRKRYVVQQSFKSLADAFHEGERLTFVYATPKVRRGTLSCFFTDERGMSRRCDFHGADFDHIKTHLEHWFRADDVA